MKSLSRRLIPLFVVATGTCFAKASQAVKNPSWFSAPWTYSDSEFRTIRTQVEDLWVTGKATEAQVGGLVRRFVEPYREEFRLSPYTKKLSSKPFFWALCLATYFPRHKATQSCRILGGGLENILLDVPIPASYEFTRVAYCIFASESPFSLPNESLLDRLLKKRPKDPMVQWHTIQWGGGNGFKPIHTRILKMAEELYEEYPSHRAIFKPLLMSNSFVYWQKSKDATYLRRAIKILDEALAGTDPSDVRQRGIRQQLRAFYVQQGKKAGVKVD